MSLVESKASTLDMIEERLKLLRSGALDVTGMTVITHKASGLSFRVGAMKREAYETWRNLRFVEEKRYKDSGGEENEAPFIRNESDIYLLEHSVWTEDSKRISRDIAKYLLDGEGFAPSTKLLVSAAEKENPPREDLISDVTFLWVKSQADLLMWRVLIEAGMIEVLIDKMSSYATEEEKLAAQTKITKVREAMVGFEAYFDVDDAAKALGISHHEAAIRKVAERFDQEAKEQEK